MFTFSRILPKTSNRCPETVLSDTDVGTNRCSLPPKHLSDTSDTAAPVPTRPLKRWFWIIKGHIHLSPLTKLIQYLFWSCLLFRALYTDFGSKSRVLTRFLDTISQCGPDSRTDSTVCLPYDNSVSCDPLCHNRSKWLLYPSVLVCQILCLCLLPQVKLPLAHESNPW